MATENKFTIRRGFAGSITMTFKDADGNVINLTGATVYFDIKNKKSDTSVLISKSSTAGTISVSDATNGVFSVAFTQTDTLTTMTKNCIGEATAVYSTSSIIRSKDIHITYDKSNRTEAYS